MSADEVAGADAGVAEAGAAGAADAGGGIPARLAGAPAAAAAFGRRIVRGLAGARNALWGGFTPGQEWTAGLLVLLVATVVAFGLPTDVEYREGAPSGVAAPAAVESENDAPVDAVEEPRPLRSVSAESIPPRPAGTPPAPASDATPVTTTPTTAPASPFTPAVVPDIVVVVRSGDALPGRDDAAIAEAFLAQARFDATVVELTDDDGLCADISAEGDVVVSSAGLPAELRDCLVAGGKILVAHDSLGDLPPTFTGGQVLSTRRGTVDSLTDLAEWADGAGHLDGATGLVASEEFREQVEAAVEALAAMGVQFEDVHFVPDGPEHRLDILQAVGDFDDAGIETVLFAARVEHQRSWVEIEAASGAEMEHIVSDVGDAVVTEDYPASFAGALAHTALRTPWWEREEGETAEQAACRQQWEGAAPPAPPVSSAELALAYTWCLHTWFVVEPALDAVAQGMPFGDALREQLVQSPLTTSLGPLEGGGYGPVRDVVLTWDAECECWVFQGDSTDRSERD